MVELFFSSHSGTVKWAKQDFLLPPVSMFWLLVSISSVFWGMEMNVVDFSKWGYSVCLLPDSCKVYVSITKRSKENKIYFVKNSHLVQSNLKKFFTILQNWQFFIMSWILLLGDWNKLNAASSLIMSTWSE